MQKRCFGEYCALSDECDRCHELKQYCKTWKKNIFNFKRRRNLAMFICFIMIIAWNVRIGFDFVNSDFKLFAILNFSAVLLFFLALGTSVKSKKIAMKAYEAHVRANRGIK